MRAFSEPFLDAYLAAEGELVQRSVAPIGWRAGRAVVRTVEGDHASILGLPLLPLLAFLPEAGWCWAEAPAGRRLARRAPID